MTDEQFKKIMEKLEELKQAQPAPTYIGYPAPMQPGFAQPYPWQPYDGLPAHWVAGARD